MVVVRDCAKRLTVVLGVRREPFPDNLASLLEKSLRELQAGKSGLHPAS